MATTGRRVVSGRARQREDFDGATSSDWNPHARIYRHFPSLFPPDRGAATTTADLQRRAVVKGHRSYGSSRDDSICSASPRLGTALAQPDGLNMFEREVFLAIFAISPNLYTRAAYWADARVWFDFVAERGLDLTRAPRGAVEAFVEWMRRRGEASTTRNRRVSALSSIYDHLRRPIDDETPSIVTRNPFSIENGPTREPAIVERPTPLADIELVRGVLGTCGPDELDVRDAAIFRILWQTGMRRVSLRSMTFERLRHEGDSHSFVASVVGKRGKQQRILIRGRAAAALDMWLEVLAASGITSGSIWIGRRGPMTNRDVNHMFERRLKMISAPKGALTPHMLRVSFLTRNPAPIDARQDAAAHSDPRTTAQYDRRAWRGRLAFELMPEVEDCDDNEDKP